jgi:hypothetical protein
MEKFDLTYSTDALNVKSYFFNKRISVYVEGKEDILFWDFIFKNCNLNDYHIEDTNGLEGLQVYMDRIVDNDAKIIVACDCDHSPFIIDYKYTNNRIIKTYGHSIENTMYCVYNIEQTIKRFAKTRRTFRPKILDWYQKFSNSAIDLLKYDIANIRFSKSVRVFGDKCNRFLKSNDSPELSQVKINKYLSSVISKFTPKEVEECTKLIESDNRELRYLIKGHFLTNGIINLIKQSVLEETGLKISISIDNLYSLMVNCINNCDIECSDMGHLVREARQAFDELRN